MDRNNLFAIEPRIVFKCYAALAFAAGVVLIGWGPAWLGTPATPIRIIASLLIAAGCCAWPLARIEEPMACRNSLLWFAGAHAVVMVVLILQQKALPSSPAAALPLQWLLCAVAFLTAFWLQAGGIGLPSPPMSLFSRPVKNSTAMLRSKYEQEIREAAGQEERNRLARDLHDSIKQQIFVIQTAAATAQARFDSDPSGAREALERVRGSARAATSELEAMLTQLRAEPLGSQGLVEAIRKECDALGFRTGAEVECSLGTMAPNEWLAPGARRAVLRVVQEALANIGRHARASHVTVSLRALSEGLELKIEDDGQGFDMEAGRQGMGLRNMRERAEELDGTIEVMSRPGSGTTVLLSLPIEAMDIPRTYLQNGVTWAALAVGIGAMSATRRGYVFTGVAVICAMQSVRELSAYNRARKTRS